MDTRLEPAELDFQVRKHVYGDLIDFGSMPSAPELAEHMGWAVDEVRASFARMKEAHVLVLQQGDREILMANPFSAVPTPFLVQAGERSWWGNCIWDAMGIAAMVRKDAAISTSCGDCNDAMQLRIEAGEAHMVEGTGIVHFSVPAKKWWDNIKFT